MSFRTMLRSLCGWRSRFSVSDPSATQNKLKLELQRGLRRALASVAAVYDRRDGSRERRPAVIDRRYRVRRALAMVLAAGAMAATARAETVTFPLTGTTITNVFHSPWSVTQTLTPADSVGDPAFDIIVCNLLVNNFGPDSRYNMYQLTVPGGSLQGADWDNPNVMLPGFWTATVDLNTTTLNGNGDVITFGQSETFQFTMTYQPYVTSTGSASAVGDGGPGIGVPYNFPTLSGLYVPVATPEPGSGAEAAEGPGTPTG